MDQADVQLREDWQLAKHGISLLLNNRPTEAKSLFEQYPDSIQMAAGLSFVTFMDALMTFEEDKLTLALATLKETEKKCNTNVGWLKSVKTRMFGGKENNYAESLECQIILADTQVCVAILTFLQQEFTGYLKGGWVLRKAWKVYQNTYTQLLEVYRKKIGELNLPEPTDFSWSDAYSSGASCSSVDQEGVTDSYESSPTLDKNGYKPNLTNPLKSNIPHSHSTHSVSKSHKIKIPRSASSFSEDGSKIPHSKSTYSLLSPLSTQFSYLTNSLSSLALMDKIDPDAPIEPETVARLMGAVCFGYGVLQLGISFLPPSLLKITSFLGFTGDRVAGISHLMYARKGLDMRAPLAMLALLWYHTIVRPFYALDGTNVKAGIEASSLLIEEAQQEYSESALFLFFSGRIHRLDSNIPKALNSFQLAVDNSPQREIKLLALHEVGWCHIIQLDYESAQKTFLQMKTESRWSKTFYSYLVIICMGAINMLKDYTIINHFNELLKASQLRGTQLEVYLGRRLKVFPETAEKLLEMGSSYWKLYIYELLFLWNALPSCNRDCSDIIITDCEESTQEPMPGLAMLIQGECYNIQGLYEKAIISLQKCLQIRRSIPPKDDLHINAYAEFILGMLLVKQEETRQEGISLIQHANNSYKEYDFHNKLQVRMDMALKHLTT